MNILLNYWQQLESRERSVLGWGGVLVSLILFYTFVWQPWHVALSSMEKNIQVHRQNLVWMEQQAKILGSGGQPVENVVKASSESLLSIVEKTAKANKLGKSIQQMVPTTNNSEVRVVLEEADFNQWLRWIDQLFKKYDVNIKQLSAERDDSAPNLAEIRITFER